MKSDVRLLDLVGIRVVKVDRLGWPAVHLPAHKIALIDSGLTQEDEAAIVEAILPVALEREVG